MLKVARMLHANKGTSSTQVSRAVHVCFRARDTSHSINLNVRNSAKKVSNQFNEGGTYKLTK